MNGRDQYSGCFDPIANDIAVSAKGNEEFAAAASQRLDAAFGKFRKRHHCIEEQRAYALGGGDILVDQPSL